MTTSITAPRTFVHRLAQEIRIVGLGLKREAVAIAALMAILTAVGIKEAAGSAAGLNAEPEILLFALPLALLLPIAVWRGETLFGDSFLWLRPISRQQGAILKLLAGSFWLVALMLAALLWIVLMAAVTGGAIGGEEMRYVVDPAAGTGRIVRTSWSAPFWLWVAPFLSAALLYLLSSALLVGLKHPLRMIAGALFAIAFLIAFVVVAIPNGALEHSLARAQHAIFSGNLGLNAALTAGVADMAVAGKGPDGREIAVWTALPSIERWAPAIALWLAIALAAMTLAIGRHRERTR